MRGDRALAQLQAPIATGLRHFDLGDHEICARSSCTERAGHSAPSCYSLAQAPSAPQRVSGMNEQSLSTWQSTG
jgi:hypothetical protein